MSKWNKPLVVQNKLKLFQTFCDVVLHSRHVSALQVEESFFFDFLLFLPLCRHLEALHWFAVAQVCDGEYGEGESGVELFHFVIRFLLMHRNQALYFPVRELGFAIPEINRLFWWLSTTTKLIIKTPKTLFICNSSKTSSVKYSLAS